MGRRTHLGGWSTFCWSYRKNGRVARPSFAWAGPLTLFHHIPTVTAVTDTNPSLRDN
jgi:hypothetical protein